MRRIRILALVACVGMSACGAPTTKDVALQIDPSIPKYHTPQCEAARQKAMQYGGMTTGDIVASVITAPAFGSAAYVALNQKAHEGEDAALHELEAACGHEAILPLMQQQADDGDANSETWMGQAYQFGFGVKVDMAQAIHWYGVAADKGDEIAATNLGAIYVDGNGVPQDYARATALWAKAADRGVAQAKEDLGWAYANGFGVKKDLKEARELRYEAALQSLGNAQFVLAGMFEQGAGGEQSDLIAYEWYDAAARNRIEGAASKRDGLAQKLSDDQRKDADARITACLAGQSSACPPSGIGR